MGLTIEIEDSVKELMKKKGHTITLASFILRGCAVLEEIEVTYKEPKDKTQYQLVEQDGLFIYVQKTLRFKNDQVSIVVAGIGPFKTMVAGDLKR
ncbi:CC/Se motif family (seleno)protein [Sporosarcina beigongshangi]|uniref:CC/Se motif family (seleno)protein n=1 Tax=Sporosarcina beigongshangi TaxID=2782538 RepID=UPI001939F0BF|nr:CC/Se motif family (seleno)protein [Sporosarcina beigongshangi]